MPKLEFREYWKEWEAGKLLRPMLFEYTGDPNVYDGMSPYDVFKTCRLITKKSQINEIVTEMRSLVSG